MPSSNPTLPDVGPANGSGLGVEQPDHGALQRSAIPAQANGTGGDAALDPHELLHALQAMQVGDFSVRMAGDRTGIEG